MKHICCLALTLLLFIGSAQARLNYPGGLVELNIDKQSADMPIIRYGLNEPVIIETRTQWRVLIGISLDTLPGEYLVYLKHNTPNSEGEHLKITVKQKNYPQYAEGTSKHGKVLTRTRKNVSEIDFSNTEQPNLPLIFPAKGDWSDTFGHQIYEPKKRRLKSLNGISLSTTKLANIVSPQNAIVTRIETDKENLSTVYLDHGRGLYSILQGLTDITVELGNGVVAGAVLGKLPSTKSNTKPSQLFWQTQLNGAFVNPLLLTQLGLEQAL